jgi:hypothetical protein
MITKKLLQKNNLISLIIYNYSLGGMASLHQVVLDRIYSEDGQNPVDLAVELGLSPLTVGNVLRRQIAHEPLPLPMMKATLEEDGYPREAVFGQEIFWRLITKINSKLV